MGVSVREKIKNSNEWWVFIRHAGERAAQKVGDLETAGEVKSEILKEIRTGRFDIAAMKAARAPEANEEKPAVQTLSEYYSRFEKVYLATSCREGTRDRYATSFNHILPELGSMPLNEITRERLKDFVAHLVA